MWSWWKEVRSGMKSTRVGSELGSAPRILPKQLKAEHVVVGVDSTIVFEVFEE